MNAKVKNRMIDDAARWYARMQSTSCSQQDRQAFERWLEADPKHTDAYAAASAIADCVGALLPASPRLKALTDAAFATAAVGPPQRPARPAARRWTLPASLAAGLLVALGAASLYRVPIGDRLAAPATFVAENAVRAVALDDGSVVHLDVGAEIRVRLSPQTREIDLVRGRAMFDVAHDPQRPFSVVAGKRRVTALGTQFQVVRDRNDLVVTLAEGSVAVTDREAGEHVERLAPGQELVIAAARPVWEKREIDPVVVTSWSTGRHVFRETRLADAVAEINRYSAVKTTIADARLADLRVSGSFATGDGESIVSAFAAVLPLRVTKSGDELLLFRAIRH